MHSSSRLLLFTLSLHSKYLVSSKKPSLELSPLKRVNLFHDSCRRGPTTLFITLVVFFSADKLLYHDFFSIQFLPSYSALHSHFPISHCDFPLVKASSRSFSLFFIKCCFIVSTSFDVSWKFMQGSWSLFFTRSILIKKLY